MTVKLEAMRSVEQGRQKFSTFKPLEDRISEQVRILSIGEFFGGTNAFNYRALLGVCGMLKSKGADLIVINGGALPEVPTRGSRLNRKKMEFLMEGIDEVEDACHIMRRPVKRLIEAAGGTPMIYVMGEEDHENIEIIMDRMIAESRKAEHIKARIDGMKNECSDMDSRISSMEEEKNSMVREIRALGGAIGKKSPRAKDQTFREGAEAQIRKLAKQIKEIARKRNELVDRRRKTESRVALLEDELMHLGAVKRTNIEYVTPAEARALRENAEKEYTDLLMRLFEGANVNIVKENIALFELGGMRLAIGHTLENTSKVAKTGALGSREQNQAKMQIYGLLPQVDLLLFSHHPGTKGWALPQSFASSHPLYLLQQGGFSDPEGLFDAYNRRIKTPHTEALEKHHLDSGATLIEVGKDGAMSFDMIGIAHLEQHARPVLEKEHPKVAKALEKGPAPDKEVPPSVRLELPSKLSPEELSAALSGKTGEEYSRLFIPPQKRKIIEVSAEMFSDHHIGIGNPWNDFSNQEIMRAEIKDSLDLGVPDIIVFGGDMVEGALGSKLSEWNARNFLDEREFVRLLRERVDSDPKLTDKHYQSALQEYYRRASYAYNVPNVDQQIHLLLPLLEHAAAIIAKGGDAVFISGNHYNQTHRGEVYDEAIRLASAVRMIGGFRENDPRIHIFYGGWIGSGEVTVRGIPIFGIHKGKSTRDHVTGLMEHRTLQRRADSFLLLQGHHHDMSFGKTISDVHVSAPAIAPIIPYVDQAALHGGLQGYTRMTLYTDESEKHFESAKIMNRFLPQLQKYLDRIDPLFLEIFGKMVRKSSKS